MSDVTTRPPLRVLAVDSNTDVTASLAMLLRLWGHDVETANAAAEALAVAATFHPDVVMTCVDLPGGTNGYELARRLRALPGFADVRLICLTGYAQEEDRRRALDAGFDHHLVKPADPGQLQSLLAAERDARARQSA